MSNRLSNVLKNLFATVVVLLLLLWGLELAFRFYIDRFGLPSQKVAYLYSMEDVMREKWQFTAQSYTNYGLSRNYPGHNSLGYRGDEITQAKPENVYRIVAVGGSTTYGVKIDRWEDTYPAQLEKYLHEAGYTNVEVVNAGIGGYTSWDSLVNVAFRVLDLDPDLIIYFEATNDVTVRLVDPQYFNGANAVRGIWNVDSNSMPISALYRLIAIRLGWMTTPGLEEWALKPIEPISVCWEDCTAGGYTPNELMEINDSRYYRRNLTNIIAIARANNIEVMLSTWTYFPDPIPDVRNYMVFPYRVQGVLENNQVVVELAQEYDTLFYDLYATMPYDIDYWFEGVHMRPAGTAEQARQYAEYLIASGVLPK